MKNYSFFSLLFFFSLSAFSQESNFLELKTALNTRDTKIQTLGMWVRDKSSDNVVTGSVYLFPNWTNQYTLITKKGDSRKILNLNYNLITKKLESAMSKDSVFQFDLNQLDYVIQSNNKYKVISDTQLNGLFLEVFNGEKIKLFKEINVVVDKGVYNPLTDKKTNDKFAQTYSYYFLVNGKYEKAKLGKKAILKYLNDEKKETIEFVSKNNLSYTSDKDVSKILNHYNLH